MHKADVDRHLAEASERRHVFHYFKDRYALMLLAWAAQDGVRISELKRSRVGRLLGKPVVRELLARCDDGWVDASRVHGMWPTRPLPFLVTLGRWGEQDRRKWRRWHQQTCRAGENVVLQLNFPRTHDRHLHAMSWGERDLPFEWRCHPINTDGRHTLAWARLDIDHARGEALIEEIQSDWVRVARKLRVGLDREGTWGDRDRPLRLRGHENVTARRFWHYDRDVLAPYAKQWADAVLAAALEYLVTMCGIRRVYYHTFKSCVTLKDLSKGRQPPRSLYTDLPKRFCFEETAEPPGFIADTEDGYVRYMLRHERLTWFRLDVC